MVVEKKEKKGDAAILNWAQLAIDAINFRPVSE
jgi:hypothetical protein